MQDDAPNDAAPGVGVLGVGAAGVGAACVGAAGAGVAGDDEALGEAVFARIRAALGPEELELVLKAGAALPEDWRDAPDDENLRFLRARLRFTQEEVAVKSGLAQSQVSRLEAGDEALLATWKRAYEAMGFRLVLLPVSSRTIKQLETEAEIGRPPRHWSKQRARPKPMPTRMRLSDGGAAG